MAGKDKDKLHQTSDIYYAAYLKVAGVPFLSTERIDGRVMFQFEAPDPGVIRDLKNQYFNRTAKVVAMTYADEVRAMKNLTHT
jgi:hypothetical protein